MNRDKREFSNATLLRTLPRTQSNGSSRKCSGHANSLVTFHI